MRPEMAPDDALEARDTDPSRPPRPRSRLKSTPE
jgi:hypothetical protein